MSLFQKLIVPASLALGLALSSGAQATTVSFTGFANGSATVQLATPYSGNVSAGGFALSVDGMPLTSFCIDLMQSISFGQVYSNYASTALTGLNENVSSLQLGRFGKLYESYLPLASSNATASAAFQTAIWEIMSDGNGSLNLATGTFSLASAFSGASRTLAQTWLATLDTQNAGNWSFTKLGSPTNQDQLVATRGQGQVPVPASLGLLAAGLFGLGFARRRKQAA